MKFIVIFLLVIGLVSTADARRKWHRHGMRDYGTSRPPVEVPAPPPPAAEVPEPVACTPEEPPEEPPVVIPTEDPPVVIPPVVPAGVVVGDLLNVDFENRPSGVYQSNAIRSDFHVNENGWNENQFYVSNLSISADPINSGRGQVLAVYCAAGQGWDKMAFKADFTSADNVYLSYDIYIPQGNSDIKQMKIPGLMFGTIDMIGHYANVYPTPTSLQTFSYIPTIYANSAWGRGDGTLALYYYDKETIARDFFYDLNNPSFEINYVDTKSGGHQYNIPQGRWVTLEFQLEMNDLGSNNGWSRGWVTDSGLNGGLPTLLEEHQHTWRTNTSYNGGAVHVDGVRVELFFGGDGNEPENQPTSNQYYYFDNFRVSTIPLTH